MVVNYDGGLKIHQPFTADQEVLEQALTDLLTVPALGFREDRLRTEAIELARSAGCQQGLAYARSFSAQVYAEVDAASAAGSKSSRQTVAQLLLVGIPARTTGSWSSSQPRGEDRPPHAASPPSTELRRPSLGGEDGGPTPGPAGKPNLLGQSAGRPGRDPRSRGGSEGALRGGHHTLGLAVLDEPAKIASFLSQEIDASRD